METISRKLSDVICSFDLHVRYAVDDVEVNTERILISRDDNCNESKVCGLHFECHVSTGFNNVYKGVDGEIEDIGIYEWILDDIQCQN